METMKISVIKVNQNGNIFYLGKMKAKDLISISTTKIRKPRNASDYENYLTEIDELTKEKINEGNVWYLKSFTEDDNIQRSQSVQRLKEIGKYIEKPNTIFPNSIICNIFPEKEDSITISNDYIEFNPHNVSVTIIDGQHRLGGFNYTNNTEYYLEHFELIVTILIGLLPSQQAELFSMINGKQRPVNKSVLYDLSSMTEDEYSEQMLAHLICNWFNVNEKSPLRNLIKILGVGEGSISQSSMIDAISTLFSNKNVNKLSTLEVPVFRQFYENKDSKSIIQNLLDYFIIVAKIYFDYWTKDYKSILIKSTGIVGLIKAYPTFYIFLNQEQYDRNENYYKLKEIIACSRNNNFKPTSDNYGGGGASQQARFARDLINASLGVNDGGQSIRENLWKRY